MKTTDTAYNAAVDAETFDDIIFDGRNLKYGAYYLRKTYNKNVLFSQLSTLLMVLLLIGLVHFWPDPKPPEPKPESPYVGPSIPVSPDDFEWDVPEPVDMDQVIQEQQAESSGEWVVVEQPTATEPVPTAEEQTDPAETGTDPGNMPLVIDPEPDDKGLFDENRTYTLSDVTEAPSFRNGTVEDFRIWLTRNIQYPEDAVFGEIKGIVKAKFTVGKDGKVCDVVIERGIHPIIDQAVMNSLLASPRWKPAKMNGREVKVFFWVPVRFDIQH